MAKKFGKFLLFTAAVGSAAAAAYYYFQKKDAADTIPEDDDYDDFSEDLDDDVDSSRNYVPLTPTSGEEEQNSDFVPLDKVAKSTEETAADAANDKSGNAETAASNVEEFFDEEDGTDEEPPITDN